MASRGWIAPIHVSPATLKATTAWSQNISVKEPRAVFVFICRATTPSNPSHIKAATNSQNATTDKCGTRRQNPQANPTEAKETISAVIPRCIRTFVTGASNRCRPPWSGLRIRASSSLQIVPKSLLTFCISHFLTGWRACILNIAITFKRTYT